MSEAENNGDFIQWLGLDMSIKVLTHLDDPCDLVRVSIVSSSWHRFGKVLSQIIFSVMNLRCFGL